METDTELKTLLDPWREMINHNLSEIITYNEEIMFTASYNEDDETLVLKALTLSSSSV
jgi:hypothetical protein